MSSMSQSLTSSAEELFNYLKDLNSQIQEPEPVEIYIPPSESVRAVSGRYKYEVLDDAGLVYDSGDWKPNLILNCGMDKVAEMPWAQVFQFAVAGTDPTPTKESYEETGLEVQLLSSDSCEYYDWDKCTPYNPPQSLLARATASHRRAPDASLLGSCLQQTFGHSSDTGRLLYLRDVDTQFQVISSCPVYSLDPIDPDVRLKATCTGMLCADHLTDTSPFASISPGQGYVGLLSADTGLPWNQGGLILRPQNFNIPDGDPTQPTLLKYASTHQLSAGYFVNSSMGLSIDPPNMLAPKFKVTAKSGSLDNLAAPADVTVLDIGEGLPDPTCYTIPVNFAAPAKDCRKADWNIGGYREPIAYARGGKISSHVYCNAWTGDGVIQAGTVNAVSQHHRDTRIGVNKTAGAGILTQANINRNTVIGSGETFNLMACIQDYLSDEPSHDLSVRFGGQLESFQDRLKASRCTSFEQLLSHAVIWRYFRPQPANILTAIPQAIDWYYAHGYNFAKHMNKYPTTGTHGPQRYSSQRGIYGDLWMWNFYGDWRQLRQTYQSNRNGLYHYHSSNMNGRTSAGASYTAIIRPYMYLPYWLSNNITDFDLSTAAGGSAYLNQFVDWATAKTNIFDTKGTGWDIAGGRGVTYSPTPGTGRGNQFSGLPLGVLDGLPTYTYNFVGDELDLGGSLDSVTIPSPVNVQFIAGDVTQCFAGGASTFSNSPDWIFAPNAGAPVSTGSGSGTVHDFPAFTWATPTIVNGRLVSITFDWDALYKMIRDPGRTGATDVSEACNDNNLIMSVGFLEPIITYKPLAAAKGEVTIDPLTMTATGINILSGGAGYCVDEAVQAQAILPPPRQARAVAYTTANGGISAIRVTDPGNGYSTTTPVSITFPAVPPPSILSYDLRVKPIDTYESINNGYWHESISLPSGGYKTDIFHTEQTYLGKQYKTHGWYVTGNNPQTNSTNCGTDFLSAANQLAMTRTFDFYMELQPVTYTEIGFKESPAARELFSRIVLDNPIKLCPGQYLRVAYQLIINMEPGNVPRYKMVPSNKHWYNYQDMGTGEYYLTGYECIQGNGMCVVGNDGVAIPYDITGVANEPYAPGSTNLGPQYGFANRWMNGDSRLSWPTKEYQTDAENPWILGGDQVNPPDWAMKFWDSPTVNYMPRDFRSYVEWPAIEVDVPDVSNTTPLLQWKTISIPSGPELPLERDAFDHWFTKALPTESDTLTFTNFVPNFVNGQGRWDYLVTKGYLADIYPQLLSNANVYHNDLRTDAWISAHFSGEKLPAQGPFAYSWPGVFPGPVIPYTGTDGSLHDPVSVKGQTISRNVSHLKNPYARYDIRFLEPNNTGGSGNPVSITYTYCQGGSMTFTSPDFCWKNMPPLNTNTVGDGTFGLSDRQTYYDYGSVRSVTQYPVDDNAGSGITRLDSWAPWSHTPLITSTALSYLTGDDRDKLVPDTVGNWSLVEAIPVAGASAFVSTSSAAFMPVGFYANRSHTVSGCQTSPTKRPVHDFSGPLSVETPTYVDNYIPNDCKTYKRAIFETNYANLTGIQCIGLGPTSTTLDPIDMTDAARFNTYVFKFGEVDTVAGHEGLSKLATYKLNVTFQNTWYRNLKV